MAKVITDAQNYADIADAIREKSGDTERYTPSQMAGAIANIQSSGGLPEGGSTGDFLIKKTETDYDAEWRGIVPLDCGQAQSLTEYQKSTARENIEAAKDNACLPTGGTPGQFLVKETNADYDANWESLGDYVVEEGVETQTGYNWRFRRWNSGRYECWLKHSGSNLSLSVVEGGVVRSQTSALNLSIPEAIVSDKDLFSVDVFAVGKQAPLTWATVYNYNMNTKKILIVLCAGSSAAVTISSYTIFAKLEGWWK